MFDKDELQKIREMQKVVEGATKVEIEKTVESLAPKVRVAGVAKA